MAYSTTQPAASATLAQRLRRLALLAAVGAVLLYLAGVTAGYLWLRYGRDNRHVGVMDVAFLQMKSVRQALAKGYLDRAAKEWEAKDYQAAFISFTSAMNNDVSNLEGRLEAVRFYRAMGAANQALALLEDGLARYPDDERLIRLTFDQLLATGRDRYALELLGRVYGEAFTGPHATLLQGYALQAVLQTEGVAAAQKYLARYPALATSRESATVVARVRWETGEKAKAIEQLSRQVSDPAAEYSSHALLASWQASAGQAEAAVRTAELAHKKFPDETAAGVLLIEMNAASATDGRPLIMDLEAFLREHAGQPDALLQLALLAGRKGWVDLALDLYRLAASRFPNLGMFGICHADALARQSRFLEFRKVLAELEAQTSDGDNTNYLQQLRHRQIIAAGAVGDEAGVRDHAQRLASSMKGDPERIEALRSHFTQIGLPVAATAFAPKKPAAKPTADAAKN